jgi:hypothetical protein
MFGSVPIETPRGACNLRVYEPGHNTDTSKALNHPKTSPLIPEHGDSMLFGTKNLEPLGRFGRRP